MLNFRSCKYWVLDVLRSSCASRVVELNLPAVVPVSMLAGWHSRYWGAEVLNNYRTCCLFQPVACYYLRLCARDSVNVCFGELYANSQFVPYLGLLTKDSVCWASWVRCIFSTWSVISGLASFYNTSNVTLKVCLRSVYNNYVDVCNFSVFVTDALKSCFGNFEALRTLLALLSANTIDSDKKQLCAVGGAKQLKLACFYSSICDEFGKRYTGRRMFEFAKLRLLKRASFARFDKLNLFKKLLSLDLNLVSTLMLFNGISKYAKAWLNLKRLRDSLSTLNLEIKHVCWFDKPAKTESELLFRFSFEFGSATGEGYKCHSDNVTSSLVICDG
ncbi:hypothetical protein TETLON2a_000012 [Candidatus Hodgkinia cicadicola]|nr:hypothetical protein TETLON2a_000012 [Candidatus Hodgkinia cicadicola]